MSISLRLKFGGLIVLVVSWCLFMAYLVTSLEFEWMPPLPLLQSLQKSTPKVVENVESQEPQPLKEPKLFIETTSETSTSVHHNAAIQQPSSTATTFENPVQIVMATDGQSLGGLIAAVNSILSNTKHPVKFYIVITLEDLPHFKTWIRTTKLHTMNYETHTLSGAGNKVLAELKQIKANFGLIFPSLEGRVIYLDTDIIVQGDIWELFSVNITSGTFGAFAQDCSSSSSRMAGAMGLPKYATFINMKHSRLVNAGIDGATCPFTAGVFVANVTDWRQKRVFRKLENWLEIHSEEPITGVHPGVDEVEAAMLIAFYGKITPLNPLWHVQHLGAGLGSRYSKQFIDRAKLLHWSGHFKPWRHWAAHMELWDHFFVPDPTLQFRPVRRRG